MDFITIILIISISAIITAVWMFFTQINDLNISIEEKENLKKILYYMIIGLFFLNILLSYIKFRRYRNNIIIPVSDIPVSDSQGLEE